jgi:SH3 domain protein
MDMIRSTVVVTFLLMVTLNLAAAEVVYVNDILRVGVRAEQVSGSNTVSVVKTGEALEVLDDSNSQQYKVKTPAGRIGWVSRTYVSEEKPAFMRIDAIQQELDKLKGESQVVEEKFVQIQELNLSLEGEISKLSAEKEQLQADLAQLRGAALIPEEYQPVAWSVATIVLLLLGYFVGVFRVHNQVRNRFGGLDV